MSMNQWWGNVMYLLFILTAMDLKLAFGLFDDGKYTEARSFWEDLLNSSGNDMNREDILFNIATCYANEGHFDRAISSLRELKNSTQDVLYNLALCNYKLGYYEEAIHLINELIDLILVQNPELSTDQDQNPRLETINDTLIVQSINLKAAILYKQDKDAVKLTECLKEIPIKDLSQFDCVTLHNTSIYEADTAPEESLRKLEHLVKLMKNSEFRAFVPRETLTNLLMLYIYEGSNESARLLLQTCDSLISDNIKEDTLSYFRCFLEAKSNHVLQERLGRVLQMLIKNQDQTPLVDIIASQLSFLLWDSDMFEELEDHLLKTKPYTEDLETWSKNMACTLYMQDTRYEECTTIYEEMIMSQSHLSEVEPIILSNLCISYILTGKNNNAEELIKEIEASEINDSKYDYDSLDTTSIQNFKFDSVSTLTLINLAVGTLYCVKYNYQFGLIRIIKTLTPLTQKLTPDTWFIAKSCILSLLSNHCRQIVFVQDQLFDQVIQFLMQCERLGHNLRLEQPIISSVEDNQKSSPLLGVFQHHLSTMIFEARLLRSIVVKIFHE